ncbi:MAG: T9SS type A sorting domain-containing protein [Bacteroidota bacterium]
MKIPNLILSIAFVCFVGFVNAQMVTSLAGSTTPGFADGIGASASFDHPIGIATDGTGNLYVADFYNFTIRKIVISTGVVTTLAGKAGVSGSADGVGAAARFRYPTDVACDASGNLYVVDGPNHTIRKIVIATAVVTTFAGTTTSGSADGMGPAARFWGPEGIVYDGGSYLYVADMNNQLIREIDIAACEVNTVAGTVGVIGSANGIGTMASFNYPTDMACDGNGNLYVADQYNHQIRKIVIATTEVTTLAGSAGISGSADGTGSAARFRYPYGIEYDGIGNLYVSDNDGEIRKIVISTGEVTTMAGSTTVGYVDGIGTAARFNWPCSLVMDASGILYVADYRNNQIRKIANMSTGIDKHTVFNDSFKISPNPFTSQTVITFNEEQKNIIIKVIDMLGKEVKIINFTGKQLIMDKEEMKEGIYFLQMIDENKNVLNEKIVIQ